MVSVLTGPLYKIKNINFLCLFDFYHHSRRRAKQFGGEGGTMNLSVYSNQTISKYTKVSPFSYDQGKKRSLPKFSVRIILDLP